MDTNDEGKLERRNLTFPDNMVTDIEEMRVKLGLKSHSEVLRKAFKLYKHILEHSGAVYIKDDSGNETKIIPV